MEPFIVTVIRHYFPGWEPPRDNGYAWVKCLCPFHGESRPSASISFQVNAFKCHACEVRGNYVTVIMRQEEVSYAKAKRIAEEIASGSDGALPQDAPRQSSRRVFGEAATAHAGGAVHAGLRGRATPWT